ncbi:hypothetical protein Glove_13g288 [Diversispora epigaea]|uniref:Uncharacterized protein n=1 Tax=Diversispora epigaea TaxID=1348612 RepID=A0A397JPA2_9GLOM|nr:hypothetical protein Glove_13g288 [Diversispora epigaea]
MNSILYFVVAEMEFVLNFQYSETNNSFIFSLKNGNIKNSILSRVKVPSKAIYDSNCFTIAASFGNDLFMDRNQSFWITNNYRYEKLIRNLTGEFSIDIMKFIKYAKKKYLSIQQ